VSKHYRKTQWFGRLVLQTCYQYPMSNFNQQCQSTEGNKGTSILVHENTKSSSATTTPTHTHTHTLTYTPTRTPTHSHTCFLQSFLQLCRTTNQNWWSGNVITFGKLLRQSSSKQRICNKTQQNKVILSKGYVWQMDWLADWVMFNCTISTDRLRHVYRVKISQSCN